MAKKIKKQPKYWGRYQTKISNLPGMRGEEFIVIGPMLIKQNSSKIRYPYPMRPSESE